MALTNPCTRSALYAITLMALTNPRTRSALYAIARMTAIAV